MGAGESRRLIEDVFATSATEEGLTRILAGDETDLARFYSPDVVLENFDEAPITEPYRGYEGIVEWARDSFAEMDGPWVELVEVLEATDDCVIASLRIHGRFRQTGIDRQGLVCRYENHFG